MLGTIPGLARLSNVSVEDCENALNKLKAPDKYSRTKDNDGRRISETDGGWMILNYIAHREAVSEEAKREANRLRVKKHRVRKKREMESSGISVSRDVKNITYLAKKPKK